MQISFFEEFPTKKNLDRLKWVSWPCKLYLAAPSVKEFNRIKSQIQSMIKDSQVKKIQEFIYWPILTKKEGYWISPFSQRKALQRIFSELKDQKILVMLDLELPTTQNPWLYLIQGFNFFRNKKLIRNFIKEYQGQIYAAEYFPEGLFGKFLSLLGLHYQNTKVIKMIYHSMHHFSDGFIETELKRGKEELGDDFLAGYGVIYHGVQGDEPLLDPKVLEKDLEVARKIGVKEVVMFRLGGLDEGYAKVLKKFC